MANTNFLIESERNTPANVIPLWPAGARPRRPRAVSAQPIEANVVEWEPLEHRLARRVERVLCALLYHSALEPENLPDAAPLSVEARVDQLVPHDRLIAIAHAAINLDWTADLTRLAAAAIMLELQVQSRWRNRLLRLFSAQRRQINADTLAIANLLAWDLDALKVRPIDKLAKFL
jgi:hypothetical protein